VVFLFWRTAFILLCNSRSLVFELPTSSSEKYKNVYQNAPITTTVLHFH
jgi:hypothetical protein